MYVYIYIYTYSRDSFLEDPQLWFYHLFFMEVPQVEHCAMNGGASRTNSRTYPSRVGRWSSTLIPAMCMPTGSSRWHMWHGSVWETTRSQTRALRIEHCVAEMLTHPHNRSTRSYLETYVYFLNNQMYMIISLKKTHKNWGNLCFIWPYRNRFCSSDLWIRQALVPGKYPPALQERDFVVPGEGYISHDGRRNLTDLQETSQWLGGQSVAKAIIAGLLGYSGLCLSPNVGK